MVHLFQYRRYRLPFRAVVRTAHGPWAEREGLIVRLEDGAGRVGYGEVAPIPWFGTESADRAEDVCRQLGGKPTLEQMAAVPPDCVCLRNALAAARDREGQAPRHRHLGVSALLPAGRAALKLLGPQAEAGFRVFKWKVGVADADDEIALLDDVCARLPEGGKLRLDANGGWDRRRAERWLECCAGRPVEFVEQPVPPPQRDLLLGLAGDYPTPLALDESIVSDGDVVRWLGDGWNGIFVIKPALLADVGMTLDRLAAAKASVVFSSALETAVGAQAALRAAFAWPGEARALGFGVWPLFADARFDGPAAASYLRSEDLGRINAEAVWNALG